MRLLIAGCGYVGSELGLRFGGPGHQVWGLRREPGSLPKPILPLAADLLDPKLSERLPPADHVVYAASADASDPDAYRAAYVDGVTNLLEALVEVGAPVERFIFVSSTAVYGDAAGGWVDEGTPPSPESFRGELVLEGERRVLSGPFPGVILRLGGIYGPGRTRLLERVRSGEARCPPGGSIWSNRIHRTDAAGILAHLLTREAPGEVYIGVDDEPASRCEVYRFLAELLDAPSPKEDTGATSSRSNKRCSNRRIRASGYHFSFPSFREGYRAMVAESS